MCVYVYIWKILLCCVICISIVFCFVSVKYFTLNTIVYPTPSDFLNELSVLSVFIYSLLTLSSIHWTLFSNLTSLLHFSFLSPLSNTFFWFLYIPLSYLPYISTILYHSSLLASPPPVSSTSPLEINIFQRSVSFLSFLFYICTLPDLIHLLMLFQYHWYDDDSQSICIFEPLSWTLKLYSQLLPAQLF